MMKSNLRVMGLGLIVALSAGGATCTDIVEPETPTYSGAVGGEAARGQMNTPLVVDWDPDARGDLEVAMAEGVAVVAYNDKGLRLLTQCHIDGKYGFIGMTRKQRLVRLNTADEISINLPVNGVKMLGEIGGELERGTTLDVALIMIGKSRTTWVEVTGADLVGSCQEATHFVRGATLGAFVVQTGVASEAKTAMQVFETGATASVGSSKSIRTQDGELKDCMAATRESLVPPGQCAALIKLELIPIRDGSRPDDPLEVAKAEKAEEAKVRTDVEEPSEACPPGFVFFEGKCTRPEAATHHICQPSDKNDCVLQCKKGNATSCHNLGVYQWTNEKDYKAASVSMDAACAGGEPKGCTDLGQLFAWGLGVNPDIATAAQLYFKGCEQGNAIGCGLLGGLYAFGRITGKPDYDKATRLYDLACRGGYHPSCSDLGGYYLRLKDQKTAASLYKRACDGGNAIGCANLAYMYEFGHAVPKDLGAAISLYKRACAANVVNCAYFAPMPASGSGMGKDDVYSRRLSEASCEAGDVFGCSYLNVVHGVDVNLDKATANDFIAYWEMSCRSDVERDCTLAGIMHLAVGNDAAGEPLVGKGCALGDPFGCELKARLRIGE